MIYDDDLNCLVDTIRGRQSASYQNQFLLVSNTICSLSASLICWYKTNVNKSKYEKW
jgi:hypothetical protein